MKIQHLLAGAIACIGIGAATAPSAFAQININGNINRQVAPFGFAGRPASLGAGTASVCGVAKAYPGTTFGGPPYAYRAHTVFNNGPARCVTITVTASGCTGSNGGASPVLYATGFSPAALTTGYLGDGGTTTDTSNPRSFGVDLGAGQAVDIVIFANSSSDDPGQCNYNIVSAELADGAPGPVPTLSEWAMIALGGLLAAFGFVALRNRRRAA